MGFCGDVKVSALGSRRGAARDCSGTVLDHGESEAVPGCITVRLKISGITKDRYKYCLIPVNIDIIVCDR